VGPLPAETARRLACDAAVTRVLVTRHHGDRPGHVHDPTRQADSGHPSHHPTQPDSATGEGLAARLCAAMALLPEALGGAPTQPLEVGRATRVVSAAQRTALVVRDGGCRYPGCERPPAWCEAHHRWHWLHGGPTDLGNLVLLCRAHHRAVHEGHQRLDPSHRQHPTAA
jgi:HNH endonuclease